MRAILWAMNKIEDKPISIANNKKNFKQANGEKKDKVRDF